MDFSLSFQVLDVCQFVNPCFRAVSSGIRTSHLSEQGFAFSIMSGDGRYANLIDNGRGEISNIEGEHAGGFARSQPHPSYVANVPCFMGSDCTEGFLKRVADVEEIFDTIAILEEMMVKIVVIFKMQCRFLVESDVKIYEATR